MTLPPYGETVYPSAFRTALACTIVGGITLYGPPSIRNLISFPAILIRGILILIIINDATLGDTLRGCWSRFMLLSQSIGPAMLSLWVIGPTRSLMAPSLCGCACSIRGGAAFGSLGSETDITGSDSVGVCWWVMLIGGETDPLMHPIRLAA
ncbi:hypothetical protein SESBI_49785 [Sesbania bispinosa]|nr:hypothetical protein SESBI_49785 [Sesbania bispinosa]